MEQIHKKALVQLRGYFDAGPSAVVRHGKEHEEDVFVLPQG